MKYIQQKIDAINAKLKLYQEHVDIDVYGIPEMSLSDNVISALIDSECDDFIKESLLYFKPKTLETLATAIAFGCVYMNLSQNIKINGLNNIADIKNFLDMHNYYLSSNILLETGGAICIQRTAKRNNK